VSRSTAVYETLMKMWPLSKAAFWLGTRPVVGPLLRPLFNPRHHQAVIIPIHEAIPRVESEVLPYHLLRPLIEKASARFRMDKCLCRENDNCQNFPHEIGCLYLGEGAARINPALGSPASVEQALAHMDRAMKLGLVPLIAHTVFDAYLLGIPYRRMLTVCFCCDCCCVVRHGLRTGPPAFWEIVSRLPGLSVEVGENCTGCGICLEACPIGAIQMKSGRASTTETCKGCGRCIEACPMKAIFIHMTPEVDTLHHLERRISQVTDIFV
jgi:ferredoxin